MNQDQFKRIKMYYAVEQVLDDNTGLFAGMVSLLGSITSYKSKLQLLDGHRLIQEMDNSGLTSKKQMLRTSATNLVLRLVAGIRAYATATKNSELLAKAHYTKSDIKHLAEPAFIDVALLVHQLAEPLVAQLGQYFVTQDHLDELQEQVQQFKSAMPEKRVATSQTKVSTQNISLALKDIDQLLKDEIDVYVEPFEFVQPDFYNVYQNARRILGYSGRGKRKEVASKGESQQKG